MPEESFFVKVMRDRIYLIDEVTTDFHIKRPNAVQSS